MLHVLFYATELCVCVSFYSNLFVLKQQMFIAHNSVIMWVDNLGWTQLHMASARLTHINEFSLSFTTKTS